jgi:hypothetical protein
MGNSNPKPAVWTENVLHLTASTIQGVATEKPWLLILFFDPKSSASGTELAQFREAAKALKPEDVRLNRLNLANLFITSILDIRCPKCRRRHRRS